MPKAKASHDIRLIDMETLLKNDWHVADVTDSEGEGRVITLAYPSEGIYCSFPPDGRPTFYMNRNDGGIEELAPPVALVKTGINLTTLPKPH